MPDASKPLTVVILAGGEATRLPGKLSLNAGDAPMLVRVFRNLSAGYPAVISCKGPLPPEIDALIAAPAIVDEWTLRGPLAGLLSSMKGIETPYVFACAGDAPFIDAAFVAMLAGRREAGDEAVVPRRTADGRTRIEPLAAVYDRAAFLREGLPVLQSGEGALRLVIDRLRTRYVDLDDARPFTNVNTPGDYAALQEALA